MKIRLVANELVDGEVEYVSLVKRGANRSPFKIVKEEQPKQGLWDGLLPELGPDGSPRWPGAGVS